MNNLPIFQYLFDQIETPFLQSVDTMVSAFIRYAAAPLQTALVLYIALTGLLMMRGQSGEPTSGLIGRMVKLCIVAWFATNGSVYSTWVQNFFLNVLPNDVIQAITTAGNGNATINANSFDAIWKQSFEAGLRVWRLLDYWDLGEEIVIVIFWAAGLIACITAFAIWFLSHVILGLFIIIGPLVIGLVLFPATRSIFERWIGAMISCVILQIVTVILVALTLQVEGMVIQKIMSFKGVNQYEQLGILFGGVCFFLFAAIITFQLPGFATALSGGLHFHSGAIARSIAAGSRLTGTSVSSAGRATAAVAGRSATAVRSRIRPTTGGSLSGIPPAPAD